MKLYKLLLTENECYKTKATIQPKGIMVHSTGANNPELRRYVNPDDGRLGKNQYGNHWNQFRPDGRQVCCHAFIGKLADGSVATYQTLPWTHRGWHAGGSANDTHIGFEICEDSTNDGAYFAKVYQEAVEFCAYLCKLYGLTEKNIIDHNEGRLLGIASAHVDVSHWFPKHGKSMDTLRADVKKLLGAETEPKQEETTSGTIYRVQIGAWSVRANAEAQLAEAKAKGFKNAFIQTVQGGADKADTATTAQIKVGDRVRVKAGATTYEGRGLASFVYTRDHVVDEISGDRVVISYDGDVVAAVKMTDLRKI